MKGKDILLDEETLFRNEGVFTPGYVPEDFKFRDDQLKSLSMALKPGLRGVNPLNMLLYGPPGTGKTTSVKFVFEQLRETSEKLVPVYVNCEDSSTRFSIFSRIHEAVYGHSPPDTGKPLESVKEKIFGKLSKEKKSLVVALDEFDILFLEKNVEKILLDLLKSYSTYGYDKVGIVGIMIDEGHMSDLDVKARSVFNPERVFFQPYSPAEIQNILLQRVKYGLYDGVLSEKLLDDVVEKTSSYGDLRVGIDLIRRSAYLAEQDASKKITQKHIDDAFEKGSRQLSLRKTLGSLSSDEKKLLSLIAKTEEKSSGKIYELFKKETKTGVKKYNEIIAKLEHYKLIDTSYTEGVKGRSRNVIPRHEPGELLRLLR